MPDEYWLQKKIIGGWSHVTWYADLATATENFNRASAGNSGYSWRVVKAETVVEKLLDEVVEAPVIEQPLKPKSCWGMPLPASQDAPKLSGWEQAASGWGNVTGNNPNPAGYGSVTGEHGLSGSVWLVHHGKKHKTRVAADKVAAMMADGYVRGGPATRFE